jgi:hypothetical protein
MIFGFIQYIITFLFALCFVGVDFVSTALASHPFLPLDLWNEFQSYRLISSSLNCFLWGIAVGSSLSQSTTIKPFTSIHNHSLSKLYFCSETLTNLHKGNGNISLAKEIFNHRVFTREDIVKLTQPNNVFPILAQAVLSNSVEVKLLFHFSSRVRIQQNKRHTHTKHLFQ